MARLRAPETRLAAGGVPAPLRDHLHPTWRDPVAFQALCVELRIRCRGSLYPDLDRAPWWARFAAFRDAWCVANSYQHPTWDGLIDYQRARSAGIDMHSTSRYRLRVAGTVEENSHG